MAGPTFPQQFLKAEHVGLRMLLALGRAHDLLLQARWSSTE